MKLNCFWLSSQGPYVFLSKTYHILWFLASISTRTFSYRKPIEFNGFWLPSQHLHFPIKNRSHLMISGSHLNTYIFLSQNISNWMVSGSPLRPYVFLSKTYHFWWLLAPISTHTFSYPKHIKLNGFWLSSQTLRFPIENISNWMVYGFPLDTYIL